MVNAPLRLASCGALRRRRLAGGGERRSDMGAVAIGLVFGLAAATERRPGSDRRARQHDLGIERERPILAHRNGVDLRIGFVGPAVMAGDADRSGRTIQGDIHERLGARCFRIDPRSFDIRLEDARLREHASARVDAKLTVEFNRRGLAGRSFNAHFRLLRPARRSPENGPAPAAPQGRGAKVNWRTEAAPLDRERNPGRRTTRGRGPPCWRDCELGGTNRHKAAWRGSRPPWRQSRRSGAAG